MPFHRRRKWNPNCETPILFSAFPEGTVFPRQPPAQVCAFIKAAEPVPSSRAKESLLDFEERAASSETDQIASPLGFAAALPSRLGEFNFPRLPLLCPLRRRPPLGFGITHLSSSTHFCSTPTWLFYVPTLRPPDLPCLPPPLSPGLACTAGCCTVARSPLILRLDILVTPTPPRLDSLPRWSGRPSTTRFLG